MFAIWEIYELGNDYYYYATSISDLEEREEDYPLEMRVWNPVTHKDDKIFVSAKPLIDYLQEKGLSHDEVVLLHYWW